MLKHIRHIRHKIASNIDNFKKYCYIAGFSGGMILLLFFLFVYLFRIHYLISIILAYIPSYTLSFILDKKFIFNKRNKKALHRQYAEFLITNVSAMLLNMFFLFILVDIFGWWKIVSEAIIIIIGLPLLFLAHKKLVFCHYSN